MNPWRQGLLSVVLAGTLGGYLWLLSAAPVEVRPILGVFAAVFVGGSAVTFWHYKRRFSTRLFTAHLAFGSIVHLAVALVVVGGDRLGRMGVVPAVEGHWMYFLAGVLGLGAAFFTWTRARGRAPDAPRAERIASLEAPEPAPSPSPALEAAPDWSAIADELREREHTLRLEQLQSLQRIDAVLSGSARNPSGDDALRTVRQEVMRLRAASAADAREAAEEDVLTQTAELLEWGVQKLPELAELDASDLLMGKTVADIRSKSSRVEHVFIDHRELLAIHPIDRQTADDKCSERAAAARAALPLLRANGMRLSEGLIASEEDLAAFRSVTGFQVVSMGEGQGYVTFEGNGRREALKRAFGEDDPVMVECREYSFDNENDRETIRRRVRRVRRWKKVAH